MDIVPHDVDFEPEDLLQNRSLETVPVCIVWQCFPHGNTVCIHMCGECERSNEIYRSGMLIFGTLLEDPIFSGQ